MFDNLNLYRNNINNLKIPSLRVSTIACNSKKKNEVAILNNKTSNSTRLDVCNWDDSMIYYCMQLSLYHSTTCLTLRICFCCMALPNSGQFEK